MEEIRVQNRDEDGALLSDGCVLCHQGAKMVLFVTGRCRRTCWYCPLSRERKGKDAIYANERRIETPEEMLEVAESMQALGTGVTGGEPLIVLDRVVEYCSRLKEHFGAEHQIHLYTGVPPDEETLRRLAGLVDEIRLHPPQEDWPGICEGAWAAAAGRARAMGFAVGIEVPALPGLEHLIPMLPLLDFLNINELEWGDTCAAAMRERDLTLEDGVHNAVADSRSWAAELVAASPKVHWCGSSFKDSVQLRERLKRIAYNTARPFDEVTDDGTIVYGVLTPSGPVDAILPLLDDVGYERVDGRIETAWWVLVEDADDLPGEKEVVERYPNGGMIVEVTPV
ncbi:4Fe-4S cluster-binding domain-containing protein [Methanoculleus sp. FWC-SCC1]|uniref:4Fe-4S cluster-binding domain-containing protein n=1 Tax=Methanoculleus frigidifontis TaxID=2584085 RepID=A0ABT8M885_9EURY|nr:radical SAM protein [Methanoculleus sp. FWC-SCC1]MDN7024144.1 4Fe-4S cluster-binding domain-containing protein [Methanoculleus sp. FWC-SCC1]